MIASLIWRMNAIFPIYPIYDIYIPIYTHSPRVSISFEITYYSERMAVFEAGMYIVGESSNAIYRPVPWDNRQLLRFDAIPLSPFFHAYRPIPLHTHLRGLSRRKRVRAERGIQV